MRTLGIVVLIAAAAGMPAAAQQVAATDPARSIGELLHQVESAGEREQSLFEQRVAAFEAASAEDQQAMLAAAEARVAELAGSSDQLSTLYSENELRLGELNRELAEHARALGVAELFGISRQAAGDAAAAFEQSLTTAQFVPAEGAQERSEFLRALAGSRAAPTTDELERLWFELHRELTAQGEVARFTAKIVQPGGQPVAAEVVRVGPFTATSGGRFLEYLPGLRTLSVLPRQLPAEFMATAAGFEQATDGYVPAVIDYTRGVLLGLYVERPTWLERIELGETIGYIIIAVGVAGAIAFLVQLAQLIVVRLRVARQLRALDAPQRNNPLGRVLLAFKGDPARIEQDADVAELRISEAVLREVPALERFQAFLRLTVAAGPLLGLIGTVVGMIITFQSITESGSSDPRLMASGIGQAMIATVLGLGIAIPLLFANALLNALSRSVVQVLDEQSAGMLAESIERRRHA